MINNMDYWHKCYDQNWKNTITPASFSHPAKFSHGLIRRIYDHALAENMIQPGGVIVDPFGGVALGALYAMQNDLHWIGCELEPKFVELGQENIALWNERYAAHFPHWGSAQLLAGDSRRLAEVVGAARLVVSSPPYATNVVHGDKSADSRLKRKSAPANKWGLMASGELTQGDYGFAPGQLGSMKEGDVSAVINGPAYPIPPAAIISSPPFAGNSGGRGEASRNGIDSALFDRHSGGMIGGMGDGPGNLGNLRMGQPPTMVVGSPPYAESLQNHGAERAKNLEGSQNGLGDYGSTPGQLGSDSGQTFWQAARQIVEQCALLLPIGGSAIWVVKDYVKNKKVVEFSDQWRQLCEACGFETLCVHRAWLVKKNGSQATMEGDSVNMDIERKSFFRRLAEKKGSPRIDWETVLCMRKAA